MNKTAYKLISFFVLTFLIFIINISDVKADECSNASYDCCKNSSYQCIYCKYVIDPKGSYDFSGIIYNTVAKSDGKGNISLYQKINTDSAYFPKVLSDNKFYLRTGSKLIGNNFLKDNKLVCPDKLYYWIYNNNNKKDNNDPYSIEITSNDGNPTTNVKNDSKDNGKAFFDSKSKSTIKTCEVDIRWNNAHQESSTKDNYIPVTTTGDMATVTVSGNNISITKIDNKYHLNDKYVSSSISVDDFKKDCPTNIFVSCVNSEGVYNCDLIKNTDLSEEYYNKDSGQKINQEDKIDCTSKEGNCINRIDKAISIENKTKTVKIDCSNFSAFHTLYVFMLILAPVIVIVLGSVDYARAVIASDENKMQTFKKKFPVRLGLLVALFLVPAIIKLIISINPNLDNTVMDCVVNGTDDSIKINTPQTQETTETGNNSDEVKEQ